MMSTAGAQSLINYQNALRATPHIFAAGKGHVAVTAMLIEARCNVDLHDKEGFTPLYIAAQEGHAAATKQLIEARCNVDPQLPCGATPLFIAAQNGHAGVTKQLIEARCNIDLQMEDASTPLFIAAGNEFLKDGCISILSNSHEGRSPEEGGNINVTASFNQQSRDIQVATCRCRMESGEAILVLVVQEGLQVWSSKKRGYFRGVTCARSLPKVVTHLLSKFLLTRQRLCFLC